MVMEEGQPFVISNTAFHIGVFLEPRPNLANLYAVNTFCLCWRSSLMLTTVNIDSMCQFISNKAAELLSFAKTLVFVLVFAFVICLCLIVCRSLSAGWFHGCGPSAWNCHSFPMGSFASFRTLFSLYLSFLLLCSDIVWIWECISL